MMIRKMIKLRNGLLYIDMYSIHKTYNFSVMLGRSTTGAPMEGPAQRLHSGFDDCAPAVGGVTDVSTTMMRAKWGCRSVVASLLKLTPMSGSKMVFSCFYYIKQYIYMCTLFYQIMQNMYKTFTIEHWWTLVLFWPDKLETVSRAKVSFIFER